MVTSIEIGGRAIRIVRPADPDRLLDDPAVLHWNRRDDYMPYWAYLWPGAYLLAETLLKKVSGTVSPPEKVSGTVLSFDTLEIGCGLGLAGLAALARGLQRAFHRLRPGAARFRRREAPARMALIRLALPFAGSTGANLPDEQFPRSSSVPT